MELKKGYKQTVVGVIPDDWEVISLKQLAEKIMVGIASSATHAYRDSGVVMFRNQNIKPNFLDDSDILYLKPEFELLFKNKRLKDGDLLTARTGYPGTTCKVPKFYEGAQSFTTLITRISNSDIDTDYLCFYLNSEKGKLFFELNQIGGGQKNVNAGTLQLMPIPLPSTKAEQTAIATALSDMDNLIAGLEKLIDKKKAIKQGAMQELLRPKEGWVVTAVGELGKPYGGLFGKSKIDFMEGTSPYIPFMNIMSNSIIDVNYFDFVKIRPFEIQNKVEVGDLLFNGSSETPEEVGMCSVLLNNVSGLYLNSFCFGFRPHSDKGTSSLYLAYFFRSSFGRKLFYSLAQGATRYNLSKANFMRMELSLPPLAEQNKIESILKDMDDEIKEVENELVKCKLLKQGMMQELLTGKTRLV